MIFGGTVVKWALAGKQQHDQTNYNPLERRNKTDVKLIF